MYTNNMYMRFSLVSAILYYTIPIILGTIFILKVVFMCRDSICIGSVHDIFLCKRVE